MLAEQAAKEAEAGNYDRAARYALAGANEVDWPLLGANVDRSRGGVIRAVRELDPKLDADVCHPPSLWARLEHILATPFAH